MRRPYRVAILAVLVTFTVVPSLASAQLSVTGQWQTGTVMIWRGDGGISENAARLWDPATQSVSVLNKPGYDTFCTGHDFLADGRLFVAGGHIDNNVGLPNASIYDPFANAWTRLPNMNAGRWYPTATLLASGDVLVTSGTI